MNADKLDERAKALIDEVCRAAGAIYDGPSVAEFSEMLERHGLVLYAEPAPPVIPYMPTVRMLDAGHIARKTEGNTSLHIWWAMHDAATKGQG